MVNWALVFFMAGTPTDYHIYGGFNRIENCQKTQARYQQIFEQTGSKMQAECRPRKDVKVGQPTTVVFKTYVLR
jgi:hypothetical protein